MAHDYYIYDHTNEEYNSLPFLSDFKLVQAYHLAFDLPFEEACESEMVKRFIAREKEARDRKNTTFFKRIFRR